MSNIVKFPVHRNKSGAICCINNCGGIASHFFDLVEVELRNGEMVPWRAAGRKYFCSFCAPKDAEPIGNDNITTGDKSDAD